MKSNCNKGGAAPAPSSIIAFAGWSSLVARQAHNLKAAGSNPVPAIRKQYRRRRHLDTNDIQDPCRGDKAHIQQL